MAQAAETPIKDWPSFGCLEGSNVRNPQDLFNRTVDGYEVERKTAEGPSLGSFSLNASEVKVESLPGGAKSFHLTAKKDDGTSIDIVIAGLASSISIHTKTYSVTKKSVACWN